VVVVAVEGHDVGAENGPEAVDEKAAEGGAMEKATNEVESVVVGEDAGAEPGQEASVWQKVSDKCFSEVGSTSIVFAYLLRLRSIA
jgi:hypothetical protein